MGRFIIGAFFGAIITVALGYLMQALIFADADLIQNPEPTPVIVITMDPRDPNPPEPPRILRPTDDRVPPEVPPMDPIDGPSENPVTFNVPTLDPGGGEPGDIAIPTVLMTLVRVAPEYPRGALQQGIEGYAVVTFSVGPGGNTQDQRILSSEPGTVFDRASLNAVAGWIYQAQSDADGNPVTVGGQSARFDFEIPDGSGE